MIAEQKTARLMAMGDWVKRYVIDYLLLQLSQDKLEEWAGVIKGKALPYLYRKKEELLNDLKAEAAATDTPIDDALVEALDKFLDAFFPDNSSHL
jgi:hypothetical protein